MTRRSGPKAVEIQTICKAMVEDYTDNILKLIQSDKKEFRWWYLRTLTEEFNRVCNLIGYTLDIEDPRF